MTCEPCTYSPESVEDSLPTSSLDMNQLSLWSGMPMPAKSSEKEQQKDGSQDCKCGKGMSECSIHPNTPEKWIAYMRDSLARTLALPAFKKASGKVLEADSIERLSVLLASFDQKNCDLKMSQQSLLTDSDLSLETWPSWGLMRNGDVFALQIAELGMSEIGGGSWLPTMGANEYKGASKNRYKGSPHFRGAKMVEGLRNCETDPIYLTPWFGEFVMGFPSTWTELKDSEILKSRSKQQSLGNSSEANDD